MPGEHLSEFTPPIPEHPFMGNIKKSLVLYQGSQVQRRPSREVIERYITFDDEDFPDTARLNDSDVPVWAIMGNIDTPHETQTLRGVIEQTADDNDVSLDEMQAAIVFYGENIRAIDIRRAENNGYQPPLTTFGELAAEENAWLNQGRSQEDDPADELMAELGMPPEAKFDFFAAGLEAMPVEFWTDLVESEVIDNDNITNPRPPYTQTQISDMIQYQATVDEEERLTAEQHKNEPRLGKDQ